MSARKAAADLLRNLASVPAERIWGRAKDLPVHDSDHYPDDQSGERQTLFDPYSLGPEGNVWAGSPDGVAEALDKAGLLAEGTSVGYVVVSETSSTGGDESPDDTMIRSTVSSIWPDIDPVRNHLKYCRARHKRDFPAVPTRYFIAKVQEVRDDDVE